MGDEGQEGEQAARAYDTIQSECWSRQDLDSLDRTPRTALHPLQQAAELSFPACFLILSIRLPVALGQGMAMAWPATA